MADEQSFDPTQYGAVAVEEPSQPFDPTQHGAIPVEQPQEPSILQKAGEAGLGFIKGMFNNFERPTLKQVVGEIYPTEFGQTLAGQTARGVEQTVQQGIKAYESPAFSRERFGFAANVVGQAGTQLAGVIGLRGVQEIAGTPKLAETAGIAKPEVPPETVTPEPTPTVATDTAAKETIQPTVQAEAPAVTAANIEAAPVTQEPAGFPESQQPFPSLLRSAEEARRTEPTGEPQVREPLSLDELRLMREKNELQMQNDISQRMTGATHPAVDERIGQIDEEIQNIANRELQQRGGGQVTPAEVQPTVEPTTIGEPNAIQPSNAQIQGGETPLGVEARPEGGITAASDSDNAIREAERAAARGDVQGGAPETQPAAPQAEVAPPESPAEAVGISQAKTEAELGAGSVDPGIGAELGSGIEYGRDFINKGGDPRLPIRRATATGLVGKNEVGIVHAELERLRGERSAAAQALEANPDDPVLQKKFAEADNAQRAWRKELQPVLTKASDTLREAYAGSAPDADPGTYQGLADIFDEHFKGEREVTPEMRTEMAKAAKGVQRVRQSANGEMKNVEDTLVRQIKGGKVMSPTELDADLKSVLEGEFKNCVVGA